MAENTKPSELTESLHLAKDVAKHLFFEGREKLASGLYKAAETVDITKEQKSFINQVHQKLEQRAKDRKREQENRKVNAVVTPA